MKLLLTSSGITNAAIERRLVELLGQPIEESSALLVVTGIYPFAGGGQLAWQAASGRVQSPLCERGWKSLGLFELTALPTIDPAVWMQELATTDALLVWGGDPVYLAHWLRHSGVAQLLPTLSSPPMYVGVSAGSMAAASVFTESYRARPKVRADALSSEEITMKTAEGDLPRTLVTAKGAGWVDFAVIPHLDNERHPDASAQNAAVWASKMPCPVYALDDQSAVSVEEGVATVVSEGRWRRYPDA